MGSVIGMATWIFMSFFHLVLHDCNGCGALVITKCIFDSFHISFINSDLQDGWLW